jgi:nucleoside-diphosphate-sugar epimerase
MTKKATVIVTGGAGFLGKHLVEKLQQNQNYKIIVPRKANFDLTKKDKVNSLFSTAKPNMVVHLAAKVGGIGANKENPGSFFYENIMMGLNLVEASRKYKIKKFIHVGTVCSYPKHCEVPFREDDLWNGFPEETNAPYGIAKKAIITMLEGYKQQYGLNSTVLLPVNLYGPGDNFDENSSHVIPALIKKVYDAKSKGQNEIVCWGTGKASREFLYVKDAAEAIALAIGSDIVDPVPINLGGTGEITIERLVRIICEHSGFTGKVIWDNDKPDGQPRRCLDTSRCRELLGWEASTDFISGIRETISWYNKNH